MSWGCFQSKKRTAPPSQKQDAASPPPTSPEWAVPKAEPGSRSDGGIYPVSMEGTGTNTSETSGNVSEDGQMDTTPSSDQSERSTPSQVPEDQGGSFTCPCCKSEFIVSRNMMLDCQPPPSKKEKGNQPSSSCARSLRPQPKRADTTDDATLMKKEKEDEGNCLATSRPGQGTGKKTFIPFNRNSFKLRPSTVNVGRVFTGETWGADSVIMKTIIDNKPPLLHVEKTHLDNCDVIIVFCPISSRVGSDVDAAMSRPEVSSGNKPVILVLMHHTRDPDYSTEGKKWSEVHHNVQRDLHVLYHETQRGLLSCKHNDQTIRTLQEEVYKYKR